MNWSNTIESRVLTSIATYEKKVPGLKPICNYPHDAIAPHCLKQSNGSKSSTVFRSADAIIHLPAAIVYTSCDLYYNRIMDYWHAVCVGCTKMGRVNTGWDRFEYKLVVHWVWTSTRPAVYKLMHFCISVYRTNTFPLIHAGFFHAFFNLIALTPLLERFEAEYGTLTSLALFAGRRLYLRKN